MQFYDLLQMGYYAVCIVFVFNVMMVPMWIELKPKERMIGRWYQQHWYIYIYKWDLIFYCTYIVSITNLIVRCHLPENLNYAKALNSVRPFHVNKE